jgi:hypothetical protein
MLSVGKSYFHLHARKMMEEALKEEWLEGSSLLSIIG